MEQENLKTIQSTLIETLQLVPSLELQEVSCREGTRSLPPATQADLELSIKTCNSVWQILVKWKNNGEPRYVRSAVQEMSQYVSEKPQCLGIIAAPYLGPASRRICSESGLGFLDLAGNVRVVFDDIYIVRDNYPKPESESNRLKSLFATKSSRVARLLLDNPGRIWRIQDLADNADVSTGLVYKVKELLLDREIVLQDQSGVKLKEPESLLREWATKYTYRASRSYSCFGEGSVAELEANLDQYCRGNTIDYAFTLFSGAERVAPFSRYVRGFAYVEEDPEVIEQDLGWKSVESGANFTLLTLFDESCLWNTQIVHGESVVSDIQLYLDLASYKGRGEEAASFLFEQRIKPKW